MRLCLCVFFGRMEEWPEKWPKKKNISERMKVKPMKVGDRAAMRSESGRKRKKKMLKMLKMKQRKTKL